MTLKLLTTICLFWCAAGSFAFGQTDSISTQQAIRDSIRSDRLARPRIAATRSAIFPGLGQIYNRRWWKVPLVYGGFVGIGLVYEFNQRYYKIFLEEAQYRERNPGKALNPEYAPYSNEGIINVKDAYRRNRDLTILAGLGFYAIQVIDAYVDARFYGFDVSDEIGFRVDPGFLSVPGNRGGGQTLAAGLSLKVSL